MAVYIPRVLPITFNLAKVRRRLRLAHLRKVECDNIPNAAAKDAALIATCGNACLMFSVAIDKR